MSMTNLIDHMILLKRSRDLFCRPVLEAHDLRISDMDVLLYLSAKGQACTAKEICGMYMVPKSLISASVDTLAGRGLIDRCPHPQDKRCVLLTLRSEANAVIADLNARLTEFGTCLCSGISAEELAVVDQVFERIHRNMNALGGTE